MANETIVRVLERRRKYMWPEAQLNFWLIVMIAAAATILGVTAYFMTVQSRFHLPAPWLFPFSIATASITLIFLAIILGLIAQRQLLPGIVMLMSFILFVLFLTGLIETAIQLYGPSNSVNYFCQLYKPVSGGSTGGQPGLETLAYLETQGICSDWKAVFAFYLVGAVFLLWMMVMSWQVNRDEFD